MFLASSILITQYEDEKTRARTLWKHLSCAWISLLSFRQTFSFHTSFIGYAGTSKLELLVKFSRSPKAFLFFMLSFHIEPLRVYTTYLERAIDDYFLILFRNHLVTILNNGFSHWLTYISWVCGKSWNSL